MAQFKNERAEELRRDAERATAVAEDLRERSEAYARAHRNEGGMAALTAAYRRGFQRGLETTLRELVRDGVQLPDNWLQRL